MKKYCSLVLVALVVAGCASLPPIASRLPVEFRLCGPAASPGLTRYTVRGSEREVYLQNEAVLTTAHIASAKVTTSPYGPQIDIVLTKEGRAVFAKLTRDNIDKPLAILVDGEVISAPIIRAPITGGRAVIAGQFSEKEADRIAKGIMGR